MGFLPTLLGLPVASTKQRRKNQQDKLTDQLLGEHGCTVCPLKNELPKLEPSGASSPLVYMLGEAPGAEEAKRGIQFIGAAGELLRKRIPEHFRNRLRWNNSVRSHPPDNRDPTPVELACCKPSIVEDIERSRPKAIFAFGNFALNLVAGQTGILNWTGRRLPVKVGKHTCWCFPIVHPSSVLHDKNRRDKPIQKGTDYYSELEFAFALHLRQAFDHMAGLPIPVVDSKEDAMRGVECLYDPKEIVAAIEQAYSFEYVGLDYETNGLRPYTNDPKILTVALSMGERHVAFPMHHPEARLSRWELDSIEIAFERFLHKAPCRKVCHNLAFEQEWSAVFFGVECIHGSQWEDSMAQAFILDERQGGGRKGEGPLSLNFLCLQHFGVELKTLSDLDRKHMDRYGLSDILPYNAMDSKYGLDLFYEQLPVIRTQGLEPQYDHFIRRISGLALTQVAGVPISRNNARDLKAKYEGQLQEVEQEIQALPIIAQYNSLRGKSYRPSAPEDIKYIVNSMLGGKSIGSADVEVLKTVKHPIAALTTEWKQIAKVISTYIEPYIADNVVYSDNKLHPNFPTMKTRTTRTSATDPNVQNNIKRDEEHKEVRRIVEAPPGHKIVSADYAGIQARNVAMESKDPVLIKAFFDHYDIHTDWCERLARMCPQWIKEGVKQLAQDKKLFGKYRHLAKNKFVFPSFFGASPGSIATEAYLGIPETIAYRLQDEFWEEFRDVKKWHRIVEDDYFKTGYVTGLSGFRRHAPVGHNEIINSPIQADETKVVMTALANLSELGYWPVQPILEVHDDLTWCWRDQDIDKNIDIAMGEMLRLEYPWINVPLVVEVSVGQNWAEMEEIGVFESVGRSDWKELTK